MASIFVYPPCALLSSSSSSTVPSLSPFLRRSPPLLLSSREKKNLRRRFLLLLPPSALADSPKSLDNDEQAPLLPLLQELADGLILPPDYLSRLPSDLRLDLNDAAFDLSNGPVLDECGDILGELLLNLARAWEQADTATSNSLARQLPEMESFLVNSRKSALGIRLISAGKRFQAMGQYGQGETNRIANLMTKVGKLLSSGPVVTTNESLKEEKRTLKFGELQIELTPKKAYIGAAFGIVFGLLSWELSRGIESMPGSSLSYANNNSMLLGKSLRGALLALSYSSTILSAFASVGLVLLGRQLSSESKSKG